LPFSFWTLKPDGAAGDTVRLLEMGRSIGWSSVASSPGKSMMLCFSYDIDVEGVSFGFNLRTGCMEAELMDLG